MKQTINEKMTTFNFKIGKKIIISEKKCMKKLNSKK